MSGLIQRRGGGGSAAEIGCLCCNPILSSLQVLLLS